MKRLAAPWATLLMLVVCVLAVPQTGLAYRGWAVGDWRLWQFYSEAGSQTTFTATLRISREGNRFYGTIYYDKLGNWEPVENVEVTNDSLSFTRPLYGPQHYYGQFNGTELTGTYRDMTLGGEWNWRAVHN